MPIEITRSPVLPSALRQMFWEVFFASKGRGVTFERHFPWACDLSESVTYIQAVESDKVCGGLVIREQTYSDENNAYKVGLLGLVCVAYHRRGQGIGTQLVADAIKYANARGLDYLSLWTSQHHVYAKHGFEVNDDWLYGRARGKEAIPLSDVESIDGEARNFPLPPFATDVRLFKRGAASIVVLHDAKNLTLAEYTGPVSEVVALLAAVMPATWRMNIRSGDPLIGALTATGVKLELAPVNLQMWNRLHSTTGDFPKINIRMLERI